MDKSATGSGLQLCNICITQGARRLVVLDTTVAPGEVLSVMGPSGVGKSTLLSLITGTLAQGFTATGRVVLEGRDITDLAPDQRKVGILFQDDLLFPHLCVGANLAFGLSARVTGKAARRQRIEVGLEEIGLAGFFDRDPATLSGGQKARVSLMRMLLSEPSALLLDEPFSRLDAGRRAQIRTLVFDTVRSRDLPCILVTHDAEDAAAAGGEVVEVTP
jgi:putative thiamine transport system ATP-binding protein